MHLGAGEIALLIVLALVLFGAKKLPQVGRAAGEAIREFKSAFEGTKKGGGADQADSGGADGDNDGEGNGRAAG